LINRRSTLLYTNQDLNWAYLGELPSSNHIPSESVSITKL